MRVRAAAAQKDHSRQKPASCGAGLPAAGVRQYPALDVFKLFFAVCVVAIHTYAAAGLPPAVGFWLQQGVFRLAVPFFFVASGFLLGEKLSRRKESPAAVFDRYVKKWLLPLFCLGTANGLLELLLQRLRGGPGLRSAVVQFIKHLVFYPYGAMWYVQACVVGALLLYPFIKKGKLNAALAVGALLYGWALLCNNYYFLAQGLGLAPWVDRYMALCLSGRNGVFVGFFWLALGLKTCQWHQKASKGRRPPWGFILLAALYLAEIYLLQAQSYLDDRALYIAQIGLVPVMTLHILDTRVPIAPGAALWMRRAGRWLYFSHRLVYAAARILWFLAFAADWRDAGAFAAVTAVSLAAFAAVRIKRPPA